MSAFDQPEQNKISLQQYMLSQTLPFHSATVRTIAVLNVPSFAPHSLYLTGSLDRTCKLWERKQNSLFYDFEKDITFHQGYVYCVASRPLPQSNPGFLTAGQDARAFAIDHQGNPITQFIGGHESAISSITQHPLLGMVVTGGWDGHAKLWDIQTAKIVQSFSGHQHAVSCVCLSNGLIVTGSEDKVLRFWDPQSGKCEKKVENAHKQIIREFAALRNGSGFLTCSNDQSVKRWTNDGVMMREYYGHQGFIFSVCQGENNKFVSGSEDKTMRVWDLDSGQIQQIVHHPATVWSIRYDEKTGDLLTGAQDYKFRVLTKDGQRVAEQKQIQEFESLGTQSVMKQQALDLDGLPLVENMNSIHGNKDGQIKVFNKGGTGCAYSWEASSKSWKYIGEVVSQAGSGGDGISMAGRSYEGDSYFEKGEYDHIFDVDLGNNVYRPLPYNDGDNPLVEAEKFCMRQHIGKNNIEQITTFIKNNSRSVPNPNRKKNKQTQQQSSINSTIAAKKLPMKQYVFYQAMKTTPVYAKIKQTNQKIPDSNTNKLVEVQLNTHLKNLFDILQNQAMWHSSKFVDTHIVVIKKLLKWPVEHRFPCIDALRMFILHPDSMKLFKVVQQGTEKLFELLSLVMDNDDVPVPCVLLSLQAICNMFKWPSSEFVLKRRRDKCLSAVFEKLLSSNKNIRRAAATVVLNYSVLLLSQSDQNEREEGFCQLITGISGVEFMKINESSQDWATLHRQLTSIGNCVMSGKNNNTVNEEVHTFALSLGVGDSLRQIKVPGSQKVVIEMYEALLSLF